MKKLKIKPLSVNDAWQGRRYKTDVYLRYERDLSLLLPPMVVPHGKIMIEFEVGFSSKLSDVDNFIKPTLDIMQKRYLFNDRNVYKLVATKKDVKKGEEYIAFTIEKYLKA